MVLALPPGTVPEVLSFPSIVFLNERAVFPYPWERSGEEDALADAHVQRFVMMGCQVARGRKIPLHRFSYRESICNGEANFLSPQKNETRGATSGLRMWRRERDSNPRYGCPHTRFPSVRLRPLGHLSRCFTCGSDEPCIWRRDRDLNPGCPKGTPVFETGPFDRSGISPRGRDSMKGLGARQRVLL